MMYQVGQRVPTFCGGDGVFLSIDKSGVFLLCRMADPTLEELRAFRAGQPVSVSMSAVMGVLVWCVRFGDLPMMDCTFSSSVTGRPHGLPALPDGAGYALTVILADAATGEIKSIRLLGLPADFSRQMKSMLDAMEQAPRDYQRAIRSIYAMSTEQLAFLASAVCVISDGKGV